MKLQLSKKDFAILTYLRENGRHTVTQIGRKLGVPRTTVFDRIKKLRKLGMIYRFTAIVDPAKLGYSVYAYVLFKSDATQKDALGEALAKSGHTNTVMRLGNDYDFLASMCFKDMEEMYAFLDILNQKYKPNETKVLYTAKALKREGFLAANLMDSAELVEEAEEL